MMSKFDNITNCIHFKNQRWDVRFQIRFKVICKVFHNWESLSYFSYSVLFWINFKTKSSYLFGIRNRRQGWKQRICNIFILNVIVGGTTSSMTLQIQYISIENILPWDKFQHIEKVFQSLTSRLLLTLLV